MADESPDDEDKELRRSFMKAQLEGLKRRQEEAEEKKAREEAERQQVADEAEEQKTREEAERQQAAGEQAKAARGTYVTKKIARQKHFAVRIFIALIVSLGVGIFVNAQYGILASVALGGAIALEYLIYRRHELEEENKTSTFYQFGPSLLVLALASAFVWFFVGSFFAFLAIGVSLIYLLLRYLFYRKAQLEKEGEPTTFYKIIIPILMIGLLVSFYIWVNFLTTTYYQKSILSYASESALESSTGGQGVRESIAAQTNVLAAVLTGKWDPDQQAWDSRRVKDSYVVPSDAGVVFDKISPTRDIFYYPDPLEVTGDVTIVSLFEDGTNVNTKTPLMIAVTPQICSSGFTKGVSSTASGATSDQITAFCGRSWSCTIPGEEIAGAEENKFEIGKAYNRFFVCEHEPLDVTQKMNLKSSVNWKYSTQAVSGRQVFVADSETLRRVENVREHYNIPKESFEPWSISDNSIDFAIGFDRNIEFLRAEGPLDDPEAFTSYLIGISMTNDASGKIVDVSNLEISVPSDPNIVLINKAGEPITEAGQRSEDFVLVEKARATTENDVPLDVYHLAEDKKKIVEQNPIEPGFFKTFYIRLAVNKDYLQGTTYQSFFIRSKVDYNYEQSRAVTLQLEPNPSNIS